MFFCLYLKYTKVVDYLQTQNELKRGFVKYQLGLYISSVEIWHKINPQPFRLEALCLTLFRMLIHHHH